MLFATSYPSSDMKHEQNPSISQNHFDANAEALIFPFGGMIHSSGVNWW
jgi:hypothetical protein